MKLKITKKIMGFVMPFTAMSILFSLPGTISIKAVETTNLEPQTNPIINQEQDQDDKRIAPQLDNLPFIDSNDESFLDRKKLDYSLAPDLKYETRDFIDGYARVIGSYPIINDMQELSTEIRRDIELTISGFNISSDDEIYDQIVNFSVEQKPGYAWISVVASNPHDNSGTHLDYYLDLFQCRRISADEYLGADDINVIPDDAVERDVTPGANQPQEITMIPLRANAESAGWKVDWEQKKFQESLKATLSKDNTQIKTVFKENLDYDMVVREGAATDFLKTGELDEYADLLDIKVEWSGDSKLTLYQDDKIVRISIADGLDCDLIINQTSAKELIDTGTFDKYAKLLGWEITWDRGQQDFSEAVLSKDNKRLEILVNAGLDYDLIINEDRTKDVVKTEKLDKPAELQDGVLYVPSSFVSKYLMPETADKSTKMNEESQKEIINPDDLSKLKDKAGDILKKLRDSVQKAVSSQTE